jgi:hypothetical protein
MAKYKIGDVVLVKYTIAEIDNPVRDEVPYSAGRGKYFGDADVFAVVTQADEPKPVVEVKPEPLKVGEFVRAMEDGELGQIVKLGYGLFTLLRSDGTSFNRRTADYERAARPADWPF